MRRMLLVGAAVGAALLVVSPHGWAKAHPRPRKATPKVTALVCAFHPAAPNHDAEVEIIAGPVAGRGWLGGEDAAGLLHKGDRLTLFTMASGVVGDVVLTSVEKLRSRDDTIVGSEGAAFSGEAHVPARRQSAFERAIAGATTRYAQEDVGVLAAWSKAGREPRWVRGEVISPDNAVYHGIITAWLKRKGIPQDVIAHVEVEQVVRADVNRDGRDEVFLSFHTADLFSQPWQERPSKRLFSYVLMRYVPPRAKQPLTMVVDDAPSFIVRLQGFCDMDRDGWAEIIASGQYYEGDSINLLHWTGRGFETIYGFGSGL